MARRSCKTQSITLIHELSSSLDKGTQTAMIILDFSKAFDRVLTVASSIHHYGIRVNTHKWIESFLFNRSQQVVAEGKTSEPASVISGLPKDLSWGPYSSWCL